MCVCVCVYYSVQSEGLILLDCEPRGPLSNKPQGKARAPFFFLLLRLASHELICQEWWEANASDVMQPQRTLICSKTDNYFKCSLPHGLARISSRFLDGECWIKKRRKGKQKLILSMEIIAHYSVPPPVFLCSCGLRSVVFICVPQECGTAPCGEMHWRWIITGKLSDWFRGPLNWWSVHVMIHSGSDWVVACM